MVLKAEFTDVQIVKAASGFYQGNSQEIALLSKGITIALVVWALVWPANANNVLGSLNWQLLESFNAFYIIIAGLFSVFLCVVAVLPQTGTMLIVGKTNGGSDPMEALRSAMIIGVLPFTMLMGLMCISLGKAMWLDHKRILVKK